MSALVLVPALFFAGMGLFALAWPERVVGFFGTPGLTVDGRNEVRAVYGGFGAAVAALLLWSLAEPPLARGIHVAVGIALLGMAFGRVVSCAVDGGAGRHPWLFLAVEIALAACLLGAAARAA